MSVFFSAQQGGILAKEFVGTKEDYKVKFEQDKKDVIERCKKTIESLENKKYALTKEQEKLPEYEKEKVILELEKSKVEDKIHKLKMQEQIKFVEKMKLEDMEIYELEPVKW